MAAFVQSTEDQVDDFQLNATVNITPLVDIMLVLLIIFLVTIPVIVKVVPVNLPEVHIRADKQVRFEAVGRAILAAQMAGVPKVGFITEPRNDVAD